MSQANEPPKFVANLSQRIELRSLNKHAALKNVCWKSIRQYYKTNELKTKAPAKYYNFELTDGSYSV